MFLLTFVYSGRLFTSNPLGLLSIAVGTMLFGLDRIDDSHETSSA